jgi:hypothetical protein
MSDDSGGFSSLSFPICIAPDDEWTVKVWKASSVPLQLTITMNSTEWFQIPIDNANVTDYLDAVGHQSSVYIKPPGHEKYNFNL